ncbi:MAG: hypothetical protein WC006_05145 [Bacilli bacterium]|nr:hypothetical protein [Bacilli bacterium]
MKQKYDEASYNEIKQQYLDVYKQSEDLYKENIHIYYDYNYIFGSYFYKRYNLYYLCERFASRLNIYRDIRNNGNLINLENVEEELDNKFEELLRKVNLIKNEYDQAKIFRSIPLMKQEDLDELISTFNEITNYVHPDLRDHDEEIKVLWKRAVNAYRHNDIESLRNTRKRIDELGLELPSKRNIIIDYKKEIKRFIEKIEIITSKNIYLINSFPYNQKGLLASKELINNKIKEVEEDIKLFTRRLEYLENIIEEFLDINRNILE